MSKYIDADKLKAEIEKRKAPFKKDIEDGVYPTYLCALMDFEDLIASLQQEQPEMDVISAAKVFLEALSKTPYNNKPITDAQIIVKQLLLFLETPSKYNPDAIVEQPEADLEKEIDLEWGKCKPTDEGMGLESANIVNEQFDYIARHFYELGLNARK